MRKLVLLGLKLKRTVLFLLLYLLIFSAKGYGLEGPALYVYSDRGVYSPGSTALFHVIAVNEENGPAAGVNVYVAVYNPRDEVVFETELTTDSGGRAVFDVVLLDEGVYRVIVEDAAAFLGSGEISVLVCSSCGVPAETVTVTTTFTSFTGSTVTSTIYTTATVERTSFVTTREVSTSSIISLTTIYSTVTTISTLSTTLTDVRTTTLRETRVVPTTVVSQVSSEATRTVSVFETVTEVSTVSVPVVVEQGFSLSTAVLVVGVLLAVFSAVLYAFRLRRSF
uniref:Macroglobulin domain-containing protein n=1 Tax=Caldiarchaeum subterraneum TaxID=311458 RepID=E6NAI5_CALS0|nr:hypothetical protein HGMM_F01D06C08 [Candidatus Caldarchaeum subterraneum]